MYPFLCDYIEITCPEGLGLCMCLNLESNQDSFSSIITNYDTKRSNRKPNFFFRFFQCQEINFFFKCFLNTVNPPIRLAL